MKKLLFPILLLVLLLSQNACHKYPDDIPSWLKEKIKGLEKETRWHKGCLNGHCMVIKEFELDGESLYYFNPGEYVSWGPYEYYIVYDKNGVQLCDYVPASPQASCPNNYAIYIRHIWSEKE